MAGIRSEQINIKDALKYFIGRHEFTRETILELISKITEEELNSLGFVTREELQYILDKFHKDIENIMEGINFTIDDENFGTEAFYTDNFLMKYAFKKVLDARQISYSNTDGIAELKRLVASTNPSTDIKNDENFSPYIEYEDEFLMKYGHKKLLTNRNIYNESYDIKELASAVSSSNPKVVNIPIQIDNYLLLPESFYNPDFIVKYAFKEVLHCRRISFSYSETVDELWEKVNNSQPNNPISFNFYPFNIYNSYDREFLEKFAFYIVLDARNVVYDKDTATLDDLIQLLIDSNPKLDEIYMSIRDIINSIGGDFNFAINVYKQIKDNYDSLMGSINEVNNNLNESLIETKNYLIHEISNLNLKVDDNTTIINTAIENLRNSITNYINSEVTKINERINLEVSTINDIIIEFKNTNSTEHSQINNRISELMTIHNNDVTAINETIKNLSNLQNTDITDVNKRIDNLIIENTNTHLNIENDISELKKSNNEAHTTLTNRIDGLSNTKLDKSEVSTTPTANKILPLNAEGKLPTSITGNADTVDNVHVNNSVESNVLWTADRILTELRNQIANVITSLDWKESVNTYNDIATTYPNPEDGWTINVKDTDITYRYNGSNWIPISANSIPLVTSLVDGIMSKTDKAKLDSISASANNYVHPATHSASMITGLHSAATTGNADTVDGLHADAFSRSTHTHQNLPFVDTRNDNQSPNNIPIGVAYHLKGNTTDGLNDGGTYHGVLSLKQWSDNSGGLFHQLGFTGNGKIGHRSGSGESWNNWGFLYSTLNKPTPAEIGAIPATASCNKNWYWSGQSGQPSWLWGGSDGTNMYVYNPSNFNVNTARTAYHLQMPSSNYGSPIEIGQYIDFHKVGSTTDYDGRLYIDSAAKLIYTGHFQASRVYGAVWNDYAELFEKEDISENIEAGDIVVWSKNGVVKSSKHQDKRVIGVFSDTYGHLIGGKEEEDLEEQIAKGEYVPVGLSGRVGVKVTGDIEIGDLITTSDIEGVGCKIDNYYPGTVIGKALEEHKGSSIDRIKILIQNI